MIHGENAIEDSSHKAHIDMQRWANMCFHERQNLGAITGFLSDLSLKCFIELLTPPDQTTRQLPSRMLAEAVFKVQDFVSLINENA
jgi:hypothetical protein